MRIRYSTTIFTPEAFYNTRHCKPRNSMQQLKYKYQLENLAVTLILSFLVLFIACRHDTTRRIPPRAIEGVLDLSDWNFKKDGPVDLSGEYEFYWSRHLLPLILQKRSPPRKQDS